MPVNMHFGIIHMLHFAHFYFAFLILFCIYFSRINARSSTNTKKRKTEDTENRISNALR